MDAHVAPELVDTKILSWAAATHSLPSADAATETHPASLASPGTVAAFQLAPEFEVKTIPDSPTATDLAPFAEMATEFQG